MSLTNRFASVLQELEQLRSSNASLNRQIQSNREHYEQQLSEVRDSANNISHEKAALQIQLENSRQLNEDLTDSLTNVQGELRLKTEDADSTISAFKKSELDLKAQVSSLKRKLDETKEQMLNQVEDLKANLDESILMRDTSQSEMEALREQFNTIREEKTKLQFQASVLDMMLSNAEDYSY